MDFLKELFTEPLSFEAFSKAVAEKGIKLANLASGDYVDKDKLIKANNDLKAANETIKTMTGQLQTLKDNNATAEDWKKKFEDLQKDNAEKERLAGEAKAKAEKEAAILARYNAACVGKDGKPLEWAHEAIKADYLRRFTEALEDKNNAGKSDADIFYALTKDDASAFKGVQVANIVGGNPASFTATKDDFSKLGYAERLKMKTNQPDLYQAMTSKGE